MLFWKIEKKVFHVSVEGILQSIKILYSGFVIVVIFANFKKKEETMTNEEKLGRSMGLTLIDLADEIDGIRKAEFLRGAKKVIDHRYNDMIFEESTA